MWRDNAKCKFAHRETFVFRLKLKFCLYTVGLWKQSSSFVSFKIILQTDGVRTLIPQKFSFYSFPHWTYSSCPRIERLVNINLIWIIKKECVTSKYTRCTIKAGYSPHLLSFRTTFAVWYWKTKRGMWTWMEQLKGIASSICINKNCGMLASERSVIMLSVRQGRNWIVVVCEKSKVSCLDRISSYVTDNLWLCFQNI